MARAAASSYRVSGFGSAAVPLDIYVEAEVLGAEVDFMEDSEAAAHPRVVEFLYQSVDEFNTKARKREDKNKLNLSLGDFVVANGRIPVVCEAIKLLKEDIGDEITIGAWMPGPWTLLSLLVETMDLYITMRRKPEIVQTGLKTTAQVLANVGTAYHQAGADFLTIHEMGGSPGVLGPQRFESVVLPYLYALISALPRPVVLSVCGNTNGSMKALAASGADALSVDQTNDLARSREEAPDVLLFGNLDPVGTISQGTPDEITEAVASAVRSGADAVWPGCDLHLNTPTENLRALVESSNDFSL
jgi:[methyl-Co(III) methanol-specific corrinoid protein]:coenzyme M methyltransferase